MAAETQTTVGSAAVRQGRASTVEKCLPSVRADCENLV